MKKTLLLKKHTFYKAHSRPENRPYYQVDDVLGVNFRTFVEQHTPAGALADARGTTLQFQSVRPVGAHGLLVTVASGEGGRTGSVLDNVSGHVAMTLDPQQHTATIGGLMLLVAPPGEDAAYTFLERDRGQCPGVPYLYYLQRKWREQDLGATWCDAWIQQGEQFLEKADLKGVAVRRLNTHINTGESAQQIRATKTYIATPGRNNHFPRSLAKSLLSNQVKAQDVLEIETLDHDDTGLDLYYDGTTKRYWLDGSHALPKFQPELNSTSADEFIQECQTYAESLTDLAWNSAWLT